MQEKPNFLVIPVILLWTFLAGYYFYRSWFDKSGLEESMKRDVERLPVWYPFRSYSLSRIGTKYWLWQLRILSTLGILIGVLALILIIYALIR